MSLRRLARWTLWGFLGLTGLAVVAVAGGFAWLRTSLPQTEGVIELAGPRAPVDLFRDVNGLVTIRAESLIDAYFAVGFAHAQDRLWQMDFMRFTGAGRLSEVVGPKTLPLDR
ncbi:MAG: penicillin acylase family protein, partial [Kiloniellales bacterium]|nr:penicillin acylase family protein [Kiloniellales bacterium]